MRPLFDHPRLRTILTSSPKPAGSIASWIVRASDGWPLWPPNHPAIDEQIQRLVRENGWGNYRDPIQQQLREAIATLVRHDSPSTQSPQIRLVSSGSAAVEWSLRALGIGPGDEVIVSAYDYPGNFRAIEVLGAKPVLVDVVPNGVTMDVQSLAEVVDHDIKNDSTTGHSSIKAVIVSHLYGHLADMPAISQVCRSRGWKLIEDACQVPGAGWVRNDSFVPIGTQADLTTLSFGGSKLLSAGCGGAIITHQPRYASKLAAMLDRPSDSLGMSPLQCAVLLPQLASLDALNACRAESAKAYSGLDWTTAQAQPIAAASNIRAAYYKLALQIDQEQDRASWIQTMNRSLGCKSEQGLVGEGFRSMHSTSDRRSRKPVSLRNSETLCSQLVVLDHRVLLGGQLPNFDAFDSKNR